MGGCFHNTCAREDELVPVRVEPLGGVSQHHNKLELAELALVPVARGR